MTIEARVRRWCTIFEIYTRIGNVTAGAEAEEFELDGTCRALHYRSSILADNLYGGTSDVISSKRQSCKARTRADTSLPCRLSLLSTSTRMSLLRAACV